ncbi:MAG: DUF4091 domain-containing protein [Lachnospiraceae bacterium]
MKDYEFFFTSSLEKVFPVKRPTIVSTNTRSAFQGEKIAFQFVYYKKEKVEYVPQDEFLIEIRGELKDFFRLRKVELIPSDFPAYGKQDEGYLTTAPGMFPDLLVPMKPGETIRPITNQYRSIWIDLTIPMEQNSGTYNMELSISLRKKSENTDEAVTIPFSVKVIDSPLPKQELVHTEWFHCDGLAAYYEEEVFSERHWEIVSNFIAMAGKELRINALLTPVFTPPIDTAVGHERKTVQLVDINVHDGIYSFDFSKLERWCKICKENQISYIEIPHFFSQWGAFATPKIMATVNGKYQQIFGWDVKSDDCRYRHFLECYIPALRKELVALGYDEKHTIYHISDEPSLNHLATYKKARELVLDLLEGATIMDALSDVAYYKEGLVTNPIPSVDSFHNFEELNIDNLWTYYCCGQCVDVPNRFFAQPSYRNRILGVLMYVHRVKGFLHWGYNFYNTAGSLKHINPYIVTHANYTFPSGDAFLVYPAEDGKAYSSIRGEVLYDAFVDQAALKQLEALTSRDHVLALIKTGRKEAFTFFDYPKEAQYLIDLRQRVYDEIEKVRILN